ncbi:hypothetical protein F503_01859 [Ophiostoma piceae UAMH 11346]|uniref:Uncharacterized protein n=1 Tax=Ophiostoma piceae (strain UAMH 11346) TaxID=1262450 RepID=S3BVZ1_OPHP1|nr:hypothetical protein F503_01859 [Ophiostoma piceae UAMH 11346]
MLRGSTELLGLSPLTPPLPPLTVAPVKLCRSEDHHSAADKTQMSRKTSLFSVGLSYPVAAVPALPANQISFCSLSDYSYSVLKVLLPLNRPAAQPCPATLPVPCARAVACFIDTNVESCVGLAYPEVCCWSPAGHLLATSTTASQPAS